MARLLFLRHPETTANYKGIIYGKSDYPYSTRGHEQAKMVVGRGLQVDIEVIYSSPIPRALNLAMMMGERIGTKVVMDVDLEEMNYGVLEGLTHGEAKMKYPQVLEALDSEDETYAVPEGESYKQFLARITRFMKKIEQLDQDILIVSHGGFIRTIVEKLLDAEPGASWLFEIGNGSIIDIEWLEGHGRIKNIRNLEEI